MTRLNGRVVDVPIERINNTINHVFGISNSPLIPIQIGVNSASSSIGDFVPLQVQPLTIAEEGLSIFNLVELFKRENFVSWSSSIV